jgi:Domain of unknown function (DUF4184)
VLIVTDLMFICRRWGHRVNRSARDALSYTANRLVAGWPSEPMPFTVAHAAAALPLRRFNLVWSAFLVGTMAPDFPYVVGNVKYRSLGHDFPGVLLFTLPASFAALWFYHWAIKRPIAGLLPVRMQQKLNGELGEFKFGGGRRMLAITFSIILGIATHLIWDSFTHSYTWPWLHFGWLRSWIELPVAGWTPMTMLLQYASTLLGLLALAIWILLWYRDRVPVTDASSLPPIKPRVSLAVGMFAIATATGLLRAWLLLGMMPRTVRNWDWFLLNFAVTAIAVAFWELLFYCLIATSREYASRRLSSA